MVVAGQRCVRQLSGSAGHHYNFILYCLYCSCILRQKESEFWVKMSHLNTKQECCRFSCSQYILSPSKYSTHGTCAKIFVSLDLSLKGSSLKVAILSILCLTSHKISTEIVTLLLIFGTFSSIFVDRAETRHLFVKTTFLAVFTVGAFTSVIDRFDFRQFSAGENAGADK